jgi:hypothetical protein
MGLRIAKNGPAKAGVAARWLSGLQGHGCQPARHPTGNGRLRRASRLQLAQARHVPRLLGV